LPTSNSFAKKRGKKMASTDSEQHPEQQQRTAEARPDPSSTATRQTEQPARDTEPLTTSGEPASAVTLHHPPDNYSAPGQEQAGHGVRPVIVVNNLTKVYHLGQQVNVPALRGVSLAVYPGEFVAVMGPSGSGKSTFMNLIGCLDTPTQGEYWLNGKLVSSLSSDQLARVRNRMIGFVFQGFNLLGRATALKNAALPMVYAGYSKRERERRARRMLTLVGLSNHLHHKPTELSGGQQQRVAIARALINGPSLLLADEPTGNLDSLTGLEIIALLQALNAQGLTIVLVTHDLNIARYAKRVVQFFDGRMVSDELIKEPHSAQAEWQALQEDQAHAHSKVVVKEVPV
jgi:putative ABC transport system ATP-binding protein